MLPLIPCFAGQHVDGAWQRLKAKAVPLGPALAPKSQFAGRCERQTKHIPKMRLVAVPTDSHTSVIFRTEDLND